MAREAADIGMRRSRLAFSCPDLQFQLLERPIAGKLEVAHSRRGDGVDGAVHRV